MFILFTLLCIALIVMLIIIGVFVSSEYEACIKFSFKPKLIFQHVGLIEKDLSYATYVRDVVAPREKEKKYKTEMDRVTKRIESRIFEGIERDYYEVDISSSLLDDIKSDERYPFLVKLASKYNLTVIQDEDCSWYGDRYKIILKEKSTEN